MREFWVGYSGLTAYPGEQLRLGRQRLRSDDGMWRDTNIEALNWTFDTTLLKADLGVAQRFSEYRTDLTELAPDLGNVRADPAQFQQVLLNLTINARDAESFRQSRTQVASDIARAVSLGRRGM